MTAQELSLRLPGGIWQRVREIRKRVAELSSGFSVEVQGALAMAATELVENAVKYGDCVPSCEEVIVFVSIQPERAVIKVQNGVSEPSLATEVLERIAQIQQCEDREALYISRLTEMLSNPTSSGKLGLFRIAFEGGFDLDGHLEGQILFVQATRKLA